MRAQTKTIPGPEPLYTPSQRRRRDETIWTSVQGVLAPLQFLVFLISSGTCCTISPYGSGIRDRRIFNRNKNRCVACAIMVTGAIWEKVVFGQYLLAPAFFWEDIVSFFVIALHLAYVWALFANYLSEQQLMLLALTAYAVYLINAVQFVWKLRVARLQTVVEGEYA